MQFESTGNRSTFHLRVNGKEVDPPTYTPRATKIEDVLSCCKIAHEKKGQLLTSTKPTNSVVANLNNSFVGTLYQAYSSHLKVELRPDDVWLAIVLAFADYVDHHAEEMRASFVTFEGKKQLVVNATSGAHTVGNWAGMTRSSPISSTKTPWAASASGWSPNSRRRRLKTASSDTSPSWAL